MTITVTQSRRYELVGSDGLGDTQLFARDPKNFLFANLTELRTKKIAGDPESYLAFPYIIRLGASLVGIYSEGDSHANSDRQIMIRSDDNGGSWSTVVFGDFTVSPPAYNFSLVQDLIPDGSSATFKIFRVSNSGGVFSSTVVSSVTAGGVTYALWGKIVPGAGGTLWRTGYGSVNSTTLRDALFESSDDGITWSLRSVMFDVPGLLLGESDIVNTSGSNWLAVCRNSSSPTSQSELYYATSADDGLTWSVPAAFDINEISGRQPNLTKLSDNSIILATGDRRGSSGITGGGSNIFGTQRTGISLYRSTDGGATWGFRTSVAPMWSTDGGQPYVNETVSGRVNVVYYAAQSAFAKPIISSVDLKYSDL